MTPSTTKEEKPMTDTPNTNGPLMNEASSSKPMRQLSTRVLAQYIRDLSFENTFAQNDFSADSAPALSIQVNLETRKRNVANQYEVITKLVATSKSKDAGKTLFLLELEYAGIFDVEKVPEDQLSPFLLIECPRITFPFVRRLALDITRDGGFPPLNLDNIDFFELYQSESKRRSEARGETPPHA
jgi:preprotein translocase subunit SecB